MLQDIPTPTWREARACVLETERLSLRRPTLADVKAIAHLANDRRIAENTRRLPHPYSHERAVAFVRAIAEDAGETVFLIENNFSPIGMVSIDRRDEGAPELGYWLGVEHWGQGFGTEAARAVIDYFFEELDHDLLFSGDHVMGWSTSIVAPPDGAMSDYMASLDKLAKRREGIYLPGHGDVIHEAPRFVQSYIRHRQGREASILHRLGKGAADIPTLVRAIYIGLDPRLTRAAGLSVLAHLEDLVARGAVATEGVPSIEGTYRLAQ